MSFIDSAGTLHFLCGDGGQKNTFHHFERHASSIESSNDWHHKKIEISDAESPAKLGSHVIIPSFKTPPTPQESHFFAVDVRGHIYRLNTRYA
jgi:hypothetical protein